MPDTREALPNTRTLYELSMGYQAQADILHARLTELRRALAEAQDESARLLLSGRIRTLASMWRDTRDIAVLTQHYYERSHRRNARYII